ncbi:MAG: class I SAM-dependent methyltransferase [Caldilineaceae bacterium]|nr:class I SAM-dependent methyltransferase [Caldilineaceae bacterium]
MKGRESGMPEETYWRTFFDVECIIQKLFGAERLRGNVVEFGCGYGTFTLPAAQHTGGIVTALDIEPELVDALRRKTDARSIQNIQIEHRDFVSDGTGLLAATQAHVMIYNLLHLENPVALLCEAYRVLSPDGRLSVIHWRSDMPTPRGPSLAIRPTPEQCKSWIAAARFHTVHDVNLQDCCQYHFGMVALK